MTKKVSVIIPSYNGKNKIMDVLSSLEKQLYQDFEVIVIIDGSTDDTFEYLKSQDWKLLDFNIFKQKNKGRSGARNAGSCIAKGEYLIFFDDDVIVPNNIIQSYTELFDKGQYNAIVGVLHPIFTNKDSSFQQYCSYLNEKWGVRISKGELKTPYITANNFGISRQIYNEMGGFDERLKDAEDFDLAVKLFEKGYPIYFDDQLIVYHKLQDSFAQYIVRQVEYKHANEKLLNINPEIKKYKNPTKYSIGKRLFLLLFSFSFFPKLIDKNRFNFLPARLRFKLFDWILEANII